MRDYKGAGSHRSPRAERAHKPKLAGKTLLGLAAALATALLLGWLTLRSSDGASDQAASSAPDTGEIPLTLPPPGQSAPRANADGELSAR